MRDLVKIKINKSPFIQIHIIHDPFSLKGLKSQLIILHRDELYISRWHDQEVDTTFYSNDTLQD